MDVEPEVQTSEEVDPGAVQSWDSPAPPNSLVEQIRNEVEELSEIHEVFIPVIGYNQSNLQIKYRMPESGRELERIGQKVFRESKDRYTRNLYTAMDTMINLCVGLYVQPEDVDEPVELDPQELGYPVQFDERLAQVIGMNGGGGSARLVLRKLFGNNDVAILSHAERLSRWLANSQADLDREIWEMGE